MTMQENGNLAKIFSDMGLKEELADLLMGIGGIISTEEAAKRILEGIKRKLSTMEE